MKGRRARILAEVVDRYIHTRRPVSSQEIVRVYRHRLSPATIRNELHALEEEGYLYKPHVSAGRVPTVQGFRFFAQWLLAVAELDAKAERLPAEPHPRPGLPPLAELLRRTALLLSAMTGQLGFVIPPKGEALPCRGVVLRAVEPGRALAATFSAFGVLEARLVSVPADLSPEEEREAEAWLAARLRAPAPTPPPEPWQGRAVHTAYRLLQELTADAPALPLFAEGWPQLLSELGAHSPEWALARVRDLLRLMEDERGFAALIAELRAGREGVLAHVGEDLVPELRELTLVTAPYFPGQGVLGVAGPLWLDYARAFSAVRYLASRLQSLLLQCGGAP
ncbi:MAG: hypothetical protein N2507_01060 [Candidatus Bipolaricaulota bacterium]|nr:hypothetical protein [Candidatus Bipolaricaulota bacterium]MCX7843952.1 hypothetical protein [Candidatus Bipolaricaulota bacterium]MDW8151707.1 hypothetical protein [Candidatus Bipolaricaulota bacterium]